MRKTMPKLLAANKDPAGAQVIAPVVSQLMKDEHVECQLVAEAYAKKIFESHQLPYRTLHDDLGYEQPSETAARDILASYQPDFLLTGTSKGPSIEKFLIKEASKRRIPSLTVLDTWFNFWQRFSGELEGERFIYMPDKIAVIDEYCKNAMIAEGFEEHKLVITGPGTPYLDNLKDISRYSHSDEIQIFRDQHNITEDMYVIVFASQPIAHDYGSDERSEHFLGYTELSVFQELLSALRSLEFSRKVVIILKLHPREHVDMFVPLLNSISETIIVDRNIPPRQMITFGDLIIGMNSIFLLEAVLIGKPTVSLQPELRRKDMLEFLNTSGACISIYNKNELQKILPKVIQDQKYIADLRSHQLSFVVDGCATTRIVEYIYQCLL
jgi:hypothetical protein